MDKKYNKARELYKKGKFKQARELIAKVNKAGKYTNIDAVVLEGTCALEQGLRERAKDLFLIALKLRPADEPLSIILHNLYVVEASLEQYSSAIDYLVKAIEVAPAAQKNHYRLLLAEAYYRNREFDLSIEVAKKLLVYKEYTVKCLFLIVNCSIEMLSFDNLDYYLRQLEGRVKELNQEQLIQLATSIAFYRKGDIERSLLLIAESGADGDAMNNILAQHHLYEGELEKAKASLKKVSVQNLRIPSTRISYFENVAKIDLQEKNYSQAFENFENMNQVILQQFEGTKWRDKDALPLLRDLDKVPFEPSKVPESQRKNIAFMVGFPRSGTTLLENILDSIDGVVTTSERPILPEAFEQTHLDGYEFPQCVPTLDDAYKVKLRERYYEVAKRYVADDVDLEQSLLIDKNPLAIMQIPLILSLFPEAKIILSIRHPLDCILSCFMQNFKLVPHLTFFADLETTFERYAELFELYDKYKEMYQFEDYLIRYEDMVDDLNGSVGGLIDYLGITVDSRDFTQFSQHAKNRVISTPSASQVTQGIYKQSTYRWQKFQEQLQPYQHIVQPFIDKFGY